MAKTKDRPTIRIYTGKLYLYDTLDGLHVPVRITNREDGGWGNEPRYHFERLDTGETGHVDGYNKERRFVRRLTLDEAQDPSPRIVYDDRRWVRWLNLCKLIGLDPDLEEIVADVTGEIDWQRKDGPFSELTGRERWFDSSGLQASLDDIYIIGKRSSGQVYLVVRESKARDLAVRRVACNFDLVPLPAIRGAYRLLRKQLDRKAKDNPTLLDGVQQIAHVAKAHLQDASHHVISALFETIPKAGPDSYCPDKAEQAAEIIVDHLGVESWLGLEAGGAATRLGEFQVPGDEEKNTWCAYSLGTVPVGERENDND